MKSVRPAAIPALAAALLIPACATGGGDMRGDTATDRAHPLGSGSVEFVGFEQRELHDDLRVIPEEGLALITPLASKRIENVDGFWWRGSRQWFKVPDHCHTTISKTADGLRSSPECGSLGTRLQRLRGGISEPGWVDDSGATGHATNYPF